MKLTAVHHAILAALFPLCAAAQFTDPGFEQGGIGWVMHCSELTWLTPSTAPHGGSLALAIQATSADHPFCPSEDPEGGLPPSPRFYQTLPAVTTGDVVRMKFLTRLEAGSPLPTGAIIVPFALTVDHEGGLHLPATDLTLSDGNRSRRGSSSRAR